CAIRGSRRDYYFDYW
nr:immunoglobulin heavy chain junction region [Mus musculus]